MLLSTQTQLSVNSFSIQPKATMDLGIQGKPGTPHQTLLWSFASALSGRPDFCRHVGIGCRSDQTTVLLLLHSTQVYKKTLYTFVVNNLQVTESTQTKFTDNVTDIHRFVYAKFGSHCVTWDFLKMNPQECPLSCRAHNSQPICFTGSRCPSQSRKFSSS